MSNLEQIIFEILIDHSLSTESKGDTLAEYFEELLENFVDDEDCEFDHHGGCQSHGYPYYLLIYKTVVG